MNIEKKINSLINFLKVNQKKSYINEHLELIRYAMAISDDKDESLKELTKLLNANFHMIYLDELIMNLVNSNMPNGSDVEKKESYFDCIYCFDKANKGKYQSQNGLWNKTSFKMQLYKYDCSNIEEFCRKLDEALGGFSKKITAKRTFVVKEFSKALCNKLNEIKKEKKIPYIHFIDLELIEELGRSPTGLAHDLSHMFVTGAGNMLYKYRNKKGSSIILTDLMPKLLRGGSQEYTNQDSNKKITLDSNFLTNYDIAYWSILTVINSIFKEVLYIRSDSKNSITDEKNIEYIKKHLDGLQSSDDPDIYSQYIDIVNNSKIMSSPMYDSSNEYSPNLCIEAIEYKQGNENIEENVLNIECIGSKIFENQIGFQRPLLRLILSEDFVSGETGDFINDILGNLFLKKNVRFKEIDYTNINVLIKSTRNKEISDRVEFRKDKEDRYMPHSHLSAKENIINNETYLNSDFINLIVNKILNSESFIKSFEEALKEVRDIIVEDHDFEKEKGDDLNNYIDELSNYNIDDFKDYLKNNIIFKNNFYNVKSNDADYFILTVEENAVKINNIFNKFKKIKKYIEPFIYNYYLYNKVKEHFAYIEKELSKKDPSSIFNFNSDDFFPGKKTNDFYNADLQGKKLLYILNLKKPTNSKKSKMKLSKIVSKNKNGKDEVFYFKQSSLESINKKIKKLNEILENFKIAQANKDLSEDFMMHILRRKLYSYDLKDNALEYASKNNNKHKKDEKYFYNYKKIFKNLNKDKNEDGYSEFLIKYLSDYFFTFERLLLKNQKEIAKREDLE